MFNKKSFYKSNDINNNKRYNMQNCFNPYEYNLEANIKDRENQDLMCQYSKNHENRADLKK